MKFKKIFNFFKIILIYNFTENQIIFFLKKNLIKNYFFFLKKKNNFFVKKNFLKNSDIFLINFKKKKYKNNINNLKKIKKFEFFCKSKPIFFKYKIIIINLKKYLDINLYNIIINLIKKDFENLRFIIITNNDLIINLNLNSFNIFFKNKKKYLNFKKIKNIYYFLNKSKFLIKRWIKNKNYKIYYWFVKNIFEKKKFKKIFKKKFFKIKILIKIFEKWLYDILLVYINKKPKFFKNFYKIMKKMIKKINIKKLFIFYEKIIKLKKNKLKKKKKIFFFKIFFSEYYYFF